MGAKSQSAKTYPVPIDYFIGKLRAVGTAGLNVALKSENPMPNGVWFRIHHGTTFTSWGEKITVTLTDLGGDIERDRADTVMIGDSRFDAAGAKLCGVDFIGVSYGYGSVDEMLKSGANAIADSPKELSNLLLS